MLVACNQSDFGPPDFGEDMPPGPGSPNWNSTNLSCASQSDCAPGEVCDGNQCRPKQCDDGPYNSNAPIGPEHMFFRDDELMIIDQTANNGTYWVDGYGASGSIAYNGPGGGSWSISTTQLTDVASVNMTEGPGFITAMAGKTNVIIAGRNFSPKSLNTGIVPVAVASGDVDGDEKDEIIALASNGKVAICKQTGACTQWSFANITGVDVAAGDVDADGYDEVVLLVSSGGNTQTISWNVDNNTTVAAQFDTHFEAVTVGDVDGNKSAEVALLEDRGWLGLASDRVHLYYIGSQWVGITAASTTTRGVDLGAGDVNGDDQAEIVVLGSNQSTDVLRWNGSGLASAYTGSVATTASPKRIALADSDADSISARLVDGPGLIAGNLQPLMVVTFPPYDASVHGGGTSGVGVGKRTDSAENTTTTVSLNAGTEVGVGADFASIFHANFSYHVSWDTSRSHTNAKFVATGQHFSLKPQVDLYGDRYGAVVVACTCFHYYTYEVIDPANRSGGSGKRMTFVVPVGGQTTVLSTPRYNALSDATHKLPKVNVASQIGVPKSYPTSPMKLDGTPVQPDEHVFNSRPTLQASDIGTTAFSMSVGSNMTNSQSTGSGVSISGSVGALGLTWGANLGMGWGTSFAVTVGEGTDFSGDIPPINDDPNTPEDEYRTHGYSMQPYVYRQPYTNAVSGEPSGYYVIDYAVSTL